MKKCETEYNRDQLFTHTARGLTLRQMLTSKVDPRAVRVNIFIMVADP